MAGRGRGRRLSLFARDVSAAGKLIAEGIASDVTVAGATVYNTRSALPSSGNTAGDQAFVLDNSRLYVWNGSGWYSVALLNLAPSITSVQDSDGGTTPFELSTEGATTRITITANDSDGDPLTYAALADSDFSGLATISNVGNVFTVTPFSEDSATTTSGTITFTASDGVNLSSSGTQTFILDFSAAPGQAEFTTPGTYSWTAPERVTSVSVVAVGGGGGGTGNETNGIGQGGAGGGLGWKNNISVTPGQSYTVVVGAGGAAKNFSPGNNGGNSYFIDTNTVAGYGGAGGVVYLEALGGSYIGDGGGEGGGVNPNALNADATGGGGAGGYSGNGGRGGPANGAGSAGSGGGGGGGGAGGSSDASGAGGGVGIYGEGASGGAGTYNGANGGPGGGGSGGQPGSASPGSSARPSTGGAFGGGGGGSDNSLERGSGGSGAVRIIWGNNRAFPSTNTADV